VFRYRPTSTILYSCKDRIEHSKRLYATIEPRVVQQLRQLVKLLLTGGEIHAKCPECRDDSELNGDYIDLHPRPVDRTQDIDFGTLDVQRQIVDVTQLKIHDVIYD
jgi:hypothetical protein